MAGHAHVPAPGVVYGAFASRVSIIMPWVAATWTTLLSAAIRIEEDRLSLCSIPTTAMIPCARLRGILRSLIYRPLTCLMYGFLPCSVKRDIPRLLRSSRLDEDDTSCHVQHAEVVCSPRSHGMVTHQVFSGATDEEFLQRTRSRPVCWPRHSGFRPLEMAEIVRIVPAIRRQPQSFP